MKTGDPSGSGGLSIQSQAVNTATSVPQPLNTSSILPQPVNIATTGQAPGSMQTAIPTGSINMQAVTLPGTIIVTKTHDNQLIISSQPNLGQPILPKILPKPGGPAILPRVPNENPTTNNEMVGQCPMVKMPSENSNDIPVAQCPVLSMPTEDTTSNKPNISHKTEAAINMIKTHQFAEIIADLMTEGSAWARNNDDCHCPFLNILEDMRAQCAPIIIYPSGQNAEFKITKCKDEIGEDNGRNTHATETLATNIEQDNFDIGNLMESQNDLEIKSENESDEEAEEKLPEKIQPIRMRSNGKVNKKLGRQARKSGLGKSKYLINKAKKLAKKSDETIKCAQCSKEFLNEISYQMHVKSHDFLPVLPKVLPKVGDKSQYTVNQQIFEKYGEGPKKLGDNDGPVWCHICKAKYTTVKNLKVGLCQYTFLPTCATCTVGSYVSLSVSLCK